MISRINWYVYIVRCADGTLYSGITTDISRRIAEHNSGNDPGAKYPRGRRPVTIVYSELVADRSAATRREMELKNLSRKQKESLISREPKTIV